MFLLIFGLGAVLMLGLAYLALAGSAGGKAHTRRLAAVRARHSTSFETVQQKEMRRITAGRGDSKFDSFASRLLPRPDVLRRRLSRTGNSWTVGQYGGACGVVAAVMLVVALVQHMPFIIALSAALGAGLLLPQRAVTMVINRRIKRFTAKFPDAIELLVRGLRSGLPISETLAVVGAEVPDPVGSEFRAVADRIKIGRSMEAALQETAEQLGTPEFQFFVITLSIQRETGGNLAETLSNLAEVLRKRAAMKLKIRALSSESKASAYIIGALPFIVFGMIWFVNSGYLAGFFTEPRLMIAGGVGIMWMAIGAFIMAQMVNFEV